MAGRGLDYRGSACVMSCFILLYYKPTNIHDDGDYVRVILKEKKKKENANTADGCATVLGWN